jgi:hypothetical protein
MHFERPRRKPALNTIEIKAIRERVEAMCERVGRADVRLADLFAMIGEGGPRELSSASPARELPPKRVRPDEVPTLYPNLTYSNGRILTES